MIPTFSTKGFSEIKVKVLSAQKQMEINAFPLNGLLVEVLLDPEVFETKSGRIYIWFDEEGVPSHGIIEDMIGLGDIRGCLMEDRL